MFLWLKTLYRKRAVTWPFIFYTIIWTLSENEWKEFKSRYSINSTPTFTVYREGSIEKTVFWTKESGMSLAEVEEFLDYVSMQQ